MGAQYISKKKIKVGILQIVSFLQNVGFLQNCGLFTNCGLFLFLMHFL